MRDATQHTMRALPNLFYLAYTSSRIDLEGTVLSTAINGDEKQLFEDTLGYIDLAHNGQCRKGQYYTDPDNPGNPLQYFTHQFMVWVQGDLTAVSLARRIALLFHDTLEDGVKYFHKSFGKNRQKIREDIIVICDAYEAGFGKVVIAHVDALTNKEGLKPEEKQAWQLAHFTELSEEDQNNKLFDKVANMWDTLHNPPEGWSEGKKHTDMLFAFEMLAAAKNPPEHVKLMLNDISHKMSADAH